MSDSDCNAMESWCLERAKTDALNRGKWVAQAERWHELGRARNAWRLQKKPAQLSMHAGPMTTQPGAGMTPMRQQG